LWDRVIELMIYWASKMRWCDRRDTEAQLCSTFRPDYLGGRGLGLIDFRSAVLYLLRLYIL
jgi:hypothetical protein